MNEWAQKPDVLLPCVVLLWGGQQGASERQAVRPLPGLLARAVPDSVLLVHHLLQQRLVVGIERRHWDVSHGTELTTVVQVFVLQTEEVPHKPPAQRRRDGWTWCWGNHYNPCFWKPGLVQFQFQWSIRRDFTDVKNKVLPCSGESPEDLEGGQHGGYDVTNRVDLGHCDERDLDCPGKAQDHVLYDGAVVIGLHTEETGWGAAGSDCTHTMVHGVLTRFTLCG